MIMLRGLPRLATIFILLTAWIPLSAGAHEAAVHAPSRAAPPASNGPAALSAPGTAANSFSFGGPFALIDQAGRRRTDRDFRGVFMLVFFGYAGCEDMCPLTLGSVAAALDMLGPSAARVQPVFITVDPARDTPSRLLAWARRVHPRLIALTGDAAAVGSAMRAYGVRRITHGERPERGKIYAHGLYLYLMRPDGAFAALIPPVLSPNAMARLIRRYLNVSAARH